MLLIGKWEAQAHSKNSHSKVEVAQLINKLINIL
jgi:hypothetical protein